MYLYQTVNRENEKEKKLQVNKQTNKTKLNDSKNYDRYVQQNIFEMFSSSVLRDSSPA